MNQQHFTNPELSKKLEQLGVESQFEDIYWFKTSSSMDWKLGLPISSMVGGNVKAYHWSDCLLPENAKKIWTDTSGVYYMTQNLLEEVMNMYNCSN